MKMLPEKEWIFVLDGVVELHVVRFPRADDIPVVWIVQYYRPLSDAEEAGGIMSDNNYDDDPPPNYYEETATTRSELREILRDLVGQRGESIYRRVLGFDVVDAEAAIEVVYD